MADLLDTLVSASFWVAVLRIATPLLFGALGVMLCERAGVLNLGVEGIMVAGAFVGWAVVYAGFGLWTGITAAALTGALLGLIHAGLTVGLGLSQHVSGLGLTLFASSLTAYTYRVAFPKVSSPPTIEPFAEFHGWVDQLPVVGAVVGALTPLTLLALALVAVLAWVINHTPAGLMLRMAGENPKALDAAGIRVGVVRTAAIMAGSALMAIGGAFLTTAAFNAFFFTMINGRGWICVALVVFASWKPRGVLVGALLFAFFDALQLRLQQSAADWVPYQLWLMVPYLCSIAALIVVARRASAPQALMQPYRRGER
jgi:simple sugar transport system permease protein